MNYFFVYLFPALILLLAAVGGKFVGNCRKKKRKALYERCISTMGKVRLVEKWDGTMGIGTLNKHWELEAEFEYSGQTYFAFAERQREKPQYEVGDAIEVYFDPQHPEDNLIVLQCEEFSSV